MNQQVAAEWPHYGLRGPAGSEIWDGRGALIKRLKVLPKLAVVSQ